MQMPSLIGNSDARIDTKGRAFLPAPFRRLLGNTRIFYLRKGLFEDCLVLYPEDAWEATIAQLRNQLSPWIRKEEQVFRQFVAEADRIELEENGRMLIPKRYLTAVGIQNDIRFIGRDNVVEIWPVGEVENTFVDADSFAAQLEELMKKPQSQGE